jgi:hypothetical protein
VDLFDYLLAQFTRTATATPAVEAFMAFARDHLRANPIVGVAYDRNGTSVVLQSGVSLPIVCEVVAGAAGPVIPITTSQRPAFQPAATPMNEGSEQAITGRLPG